MSKKIGTAEIEQFIAEGVYAETTIKAYRKVLGDFVEYVKPGTDGWELRAIGYRDTKKCGPHGKAMYLAIAKSFLTWCVLEGMLQKNPLQKVTVRVSKMGNRTSLTNEQVKALLDTLEKACKPSNKKDRVIAYRDRAAVIFMLHTAMRISGAIGIDLADFTLDGSGTGGEVHYKCKGHIGKDSRAYVTEAPFKAIDEYLKITKRTWKSEGPLFITSSGRRIGYDGMAKSLKQRFAEAGISGKGICAHTLRHTAASRAFESGADLRSLMDMLGHTSLNTTQIYIHGLKGVEHSAEAKIHYD